MPVKPCDQLRSRITEIRKGVPAFLETLAVALARKSLAPAREARRELIRAIEETRYQRDNVKWQIEERQEFAQQHGFDWVGMPNELWVVSVLRGREYFLANPAGEIISPPSTVPYEEFDGIWHGRSDDDARFFLQSNGLPFTDTKLYHGTVFREGLVTGHLTNDWHDPETVVMDREGRIVLRVEGGMSAFNEGVSLVTSGNKQFFIKPTGQQEPSEDYDRASWFQHGFAYVEKNGEGHIIDHDGWSVLKIPFQDYYDDSDGIIGLKREGKWHIFLDERLRLSRETYDAVRHRYGKWYGVKQDGKWYCTTVDGTPKHGPYADVRYFSDGLLLAKVGARWKLINPETGRPVFPGMLGEDDWYDHGMVMRQSRDGRSAQLVNRFDDVVSKHDATGTFEDGLWYFEKGGRHEWIDRLGRTVFKTWV